MTSGFVAACPRLTELTILCPHPHLLPHDFRFSETGATLSPVRSARSVTVEVVNVCKELTDFNTLQIVHFSLSASGPGGGLEGERANRLRITNQASREQAESMKDWALDCLKKSRTGCELEGKKKRMLRVIELSSSIADLGTPYRARSHLGPVKVEEYEVWGTDSEGP